MVSGCAAESRDKVSPQFWFGFHVLIVLFIDWPLKSFGFLLHTSRLYKLYRHGSLRDFESIGRRVDLAKFAAPGQIFQRNVNKRLMLTTRKHRWVGVV